MPKLHITDQLGYQLSLPKVPVRIVSLVPSITYLLYVLGLEEQIVGITRFCKFPPHLLKEKVRVGGTKDVKFDRIASLQPDIILVNKEENTKEMVLELRKIAPVYVSEVSDMTENNRLISDFGTIFNRQKLAKKLIDYIQSGIDGRHYIENPLKKAVYFIWKEPWMTVGGDTFISYMMQLAGFENVFSGEKRYPQVDLKALQERNPEVILLSSEPYPFKEKEQAFLQEQFPDACVLLVEGEVFTWFGAYPAEAFSYFNSLQKQIDLCIQKKKN